MHSHGSEFPMDAVPSAMEPAARFEGSPAGGASDTPAAERDVSLADAQTDSWVAEVARSMAAAATMGNSASPSTRHSSAESCHSNGADLGSSEEGGGDDDETAPLMLRKLKTSSSWNESSFGGKTITLVGSVVLTINNISGAGMLTLPQVYQDAGWVIPTLVFALIMVSSTFAATFLSDAVARLPGNQYFTRRVEFACVFEELYGLRAKRIAQVLLTLCLYSQIVTGIIATAKVLDGFIVYVNPNRATYALQLTPTVDFITWKPPYHPAEDRWFGSMPTIEPPCNTTDAIPFQDGKSGVIVSLGYLLLMLVLLPMSFQTLDENINMQYLSFALLFLAVLVFCLQFVNQGLDLARVPAFGESYAGMLGSIMFNYGFVVMVPSWLNEKKPSVSVNKTLWTSTVVSTILYILIGVLGGLAYEDIDGNFLNTLSSHCNPRLTRLTAFSFAVICVGLSVPVFVIMLRYNLIVGELCSESASFFWSIGFPWTVSFLFYKGNLFNDLISISGQVVNGPINFILPFMACLKGLQLAKAAADARRVQGLAKLERKPSFRVIPKAMAELQPRIAWFFMIMIVGMLLVSFVLAALCEGTSVGLC